MDEKLHGHKQSHSPHSWNCQNTRKLQYLLRDSRVYTMFSLEHSCFRTLWQSLRSELSASREECLFPLASKMLQMITSTCLMDSHLLGPGRYTAEGEQGYYLVSCQVFNLHGVMQPATEDWLHL